VSSIQSQTFGGTFINMGVQGIGPTSPLNSITPVTTHSLYVQRTTSLADPQGAREVLWVAAGATSAGWVVASATPIRRYSVNNPAGTVIADFVGQSLINYSIDEYGNSSTATLYISGSGSTSWYAV